MGGCTIKWCGKSSANSNYRRDGITFHRFPKNAKIKEKWIDATFRGESWYPGRTSVICSRHFTEDNFHQIGQRRRLLASAVPTIYLPMLSTFPKSGDVDRTVEVKVRQLDDDVVPTTRTHQINDLTQQQNNPAAVVLKLEVIDDEEEEGTDIKQEIDSTPQDPLLITPSQQQNFMSETPTNTRKRYPISDPDTPDAYDCPVKKRLCRRIMELKSQVQQKNVKLRKLRDANRRSKAKLILLNSRLGGLEKKDLS